MRRAKKKEEHEFAIIEVITGVARIRQVITGVLYQDVYQIGEKKLI